MTHIKIIFARWLNSKKSTGRLKTSFLNQTVKNADLHKAVLNKKMTTQE